MARRSRMTILKRQRELKKAEKAALKRAKRHGLKEEGTAEPTPTAAAAELLGLKPITPKSDDSEEKSMNEMLDRYEQDEMALDDELNSWDDDDNDDDPKER